MSENKWKPVEFEEWLKIHGLEKEFKKQLKESQCSECAGTAQQECLVCDGDGEHECECGDLHECGACDATGFVLCKACENEKTDKKATALYDEYTKNLIRDKRLLEAAGK